MSLGQFVAFAVFAVVTSITPGPNNLMLTATGANVGVRRGLPHLSGVAIGFALMFFVVGAGAGAALVASPPAMRVVRVLGVIVLLWLAWKIATAQRGTTAARRRPVGFFEAALFQWVNPKAWLICVSAVGTFLNAGGAEGVLQAASFALLFLAAGVPCMFVWLGFGAVMQRLLRSDGALRGFNIGMGALLAATVVVLV